MGPIGSNSSVSWSPSQGNEASDVSKVGSSSMRSLTASRGLLPLSIEGSPSDLASRSHRCDQFPAPRPRWVHQCGSDVDDLPATVGGVMPFVVSVGIKANALSPFRCIPRIGNRPSAASVEQNATTAQSQTLPGVRGHGRKPFCLECRIWVWPDRRIGKWS